MEQENPGSSQVANLLYTEANNAMVVPQKGWRWELKAEVALDLHSSTVPQADLCPHIIHMSNISEQNQEGENEKEERKGERREGKKEARKEKRTERGRKREEEGRGMERMREYGRAWEGRGGKERGR